LGAAGAVDLSTNAITNVPTLNFFNATTGSQVTLTAAQMGAFTTYGNLGGSNDQLIFSAAGTATMTDTTLNGIEVIDGSVGAVTVQSTTGLDLTGVTLTSVENINVDTTGNINLSGTTFINSGDVTLKNDTTLSQTVIVNDTTSLGTTRIVNFDILSKDNTTDIFDYDGTITEIATLGTQDAFETLDLSKNTAIMVATETAVLEMKKADLGSLTPAGVIAEFSANGLETDAAGESFLIVAYKGVDAAIFKADDTNSNGVIAEGEITKIAEFSNVDPESKLDKFAFEDIV
ncbi:MAG: hypothetical protein O7I42_18375, partial [Alphaproteobacteria bacterium]|nr:hypothetical protein [Alphaproteobacteria bacterium]